MEFILEKIANSTTPKVKISRIFEDCSEDIQKICNNVEKDIALKSYWSEIFHNVKTEAAVENVIFDLYFIDFEELEIKRQMYNNNLTIRRSVVQSQTNEIEDLFDSATPSEPIKLTNIDNMMKLEDEKDALVYEPNYSKKDLLFYGIIDLDTKNKNHSSNKIFTKKERDFFVKEYRCSIKKNKDIYAIAESILTEENISYKEMLKKRKAEARSMVSCHEKGLTKRVVKAMKVYQHTENSLNFFSENEFTFLFLRPILMQILKDNNLALKLGENHLKCARKHTNDETRAATGRKIDIIISSTSLLFEISIAEVSGPLNKVDKTHFLNDRTKIAKNLKYIHKQIEKVTPTPNLSGLKKLKLFGVQVYLNNLYIYSLTKINQRYYVFLTEKKIVLPTNMALLRDQLPQFFSSFWSFSDMLKETVANIEGFLAKSSAEDIASSDFDASSLDNSPQKKQKTRV